MAAGNEMEELKKLISIGKEKGFLTYDELNNALPPDIVSSDQIDDMMMIFDEMDIQVVESVDMVKSSKKPDEDKMEAEQDQGFEAEPEARVTDPVKMYLREMGLVSLLTREGEVEIAKRIEEGEQEVIASILETTVGVDEILGLGQKLRNDELRLKEVVKDADEEDEVYVESEQRKEKVLELIDQVQQLDQQNQNLQKRLKSTATLATKKKHREKIKTNKLEIARLFRELRLDKRQTDAMVDRLRCSERVIDESQRVIDQCLDRCGKSLPDLKELCKTIRKDPKTAVR
ncbi:MAG: RNA polymerase sigma factor region1.1 domain-containing protein, partial [Thermodesulfobacteriota bacterium]